jgi:hypothetical protein
LRVIAMDAMWVEIGGKEGLGLEMGKAGAVVGIW